MNLIRLKSIGSEVKQIEYFLTGQGFYVGEVDGKFDTATMAATMAYQRSRGLKDDGIIGNLTLGKMLTEGLILLPTPDTGKSAVYPAGFPVRPAGLSPMSSAQSDLVFGKFAYVSAPVAGNAEAIRITDGWDARNITRFVIPQLQTLGLSKTGNATGNKKIVDQTIALWQAWEDAGLLKHVKSWEGMWVARFIRGSRSTLSNHAKGSAFDINYTGNELGKIPAAAGTSNSVRELVALAVRFGFYWGGWFSRGDGMHFEVVKVLTPQQLAEVVASLEKPDSAAPSQP